MAIVDATPGHICGSLDKQDIMVVQRNWFLDEIGKRLHGPRPKLPDSFNWTKHVECSGDRTFVNIRVRSRGCRHNYLGGCTMCDYWVGDSVDAQQMMALSREALSSLDFTPTLLIFGPSGSWFDDWEVPAKARPEMYRMLSEVGASSYLFFTRAETVTGDKLEEMGRYLDLREVSIDMGLETADPWKLKYCVNKAQDINEVATAARLIRQYGASSAAYILVGVPFLTLAEMIGDAVASVNWSFDQGIDYCVVFPVHIKPWTVVYWLHEQGMYPRMSLWSLVEVLTRFPPEKLKRIGISWHAPRPDRVHPAYDQTDVLPTTCPVCYDHVLEILDSYRFSPDRGQTVKSLQKLECECKQIWLEESRFMASHPLPERVRQAYQRMGKSILGAEWWTLHGKDVLASVPDRM